MNRWKARFTNLPYLLTPPIFSILKNKWRDRNRSLPNIPNHDLYRPVYSPWLGGENFGQVRDNIMKFSLVSPDRAWILYKLAQNTIHLGGNIVECGVYKGGTAHLFANLIQDNSSQLFLFDTYEGMPETNEDLDKHRSGDFADTSLEKVKQNVGFSKNVIFQKGFIPDSFESVDIGDISLLHIDLDIHDSIIASLKHCYDKVLPGGAIVFDDYGFESCYGARLAVDTFFEDKTEEPIPLGTGQAIVIKS